MVYPERSRRTDTSFSLRERITEKFYAYNAKSGETYEDLTDWVISQLLSEIKGALLTKEQLTEINNSMPSTAKYGEVFESIAKAQIEAVLKILGEK